MYTFTTFKETKLSIKLFEIPLKGKNSFIVSGTQSVTEKKNLLNKCADLISKTIICIHVDVVRLWQNNFKQFYISEFLVIK